MAGKDQEIIGTFIDSAVWDGVEKAAVSVRDGVLEYLGAEINRDPPDRMFTVYRSPATIANVANAMIGIPLTDNHVDLDAPVDNPVGSIIDSAMIDLIDESTSSKLAIRNRIRVDEPMVAALDCGKRELSLGYTGKLIPHDIFDFEQRDIVPLHLAVVEAGRCGPQCRFIDHKKKEAILPKLHQAFKDAEGAPNLEQIVEIAQALPEALKKLPMDKLAEIMPVLQEIIALGGVAAEPEPPLAPEPEGEMSDADLDEDGNPKKKEEIKDAGGIGKTPPPFSDSKEFKDAVLVGIKKAVSAHTDAIVKAKDFVDAQYDFVGKATDVIMRDALSVIHGKEKFSDEELPIAFKMLKQPASDLTNFGDQGQGGKFSQLKDKEV